MLMNRLNNTSLLSLDLCCLIGKLFHSIMTQLLIFSFVKFACNNVIRK